VKEIGYSGKRKAKAARGAGFSVSPGEKQERVVPAEKPLHVSPAVNARCVNLLGQKGGRRTRRRDVNGVSTDGRAGVEEIRAFPELVGWPRALRGRIKNSVEMAGGKPVEKVATVGEAARLSVLKSTGSGQ